MDCRTTSIHKFRTRLGFKNVLSYWVDLSSHKLAIEIDENRHSNRNIDYEIKRQKAIEQNLG